MIWLFDMTEPGEPKMTMPPSLASVTTLPVTVLDAQAGHDQRSSAESARRTETDAVGPLPRRNRSRAAAELLLGVGRLARRSDGVVDDLTSLAGVASPSGGQERPLQARRTR